MALSEGRKLITMPDAVPRYETFPVAANAVIYEGAIIMCDGGYWKPATASPATLQGAAWIACEDVDNTGGANGAVTVKAVSEIFAVLPNSSGHPLLVTDYGLAVRCEDDEKVTRYGNGPTLGEFRGFYQSNTSWPIVYVYGARMQVSRGEIESDALGTSLAIDSTSKKVIVNAAAVNAAALQTLLAATALVFAANYDQFPVIGSPGAVTLTADLPAATENRIITVVGTDDTNTVTIAHNKNTVHLGGLNVTLAEGDTIVYRGLADGSWREMYRSIKQ